MSGAAKKRLAIDLYCGLGGWAEGFLAEGYNVIGFDIERRPYPGQLVLQDVLTLHGSQFKDATVIVASPPCQAYSYRAMPWKRAKALPPPSNELFDACFRIQREACEAAGRYIPMVVENVQGAQPWVGRAKWHYGSYYLWGDIPALMPVVNAFKVPGFRFDGSGGSFQSASIEAQKRNPDGTEHGPGSWFKIADSKNRGLKTIGHSKNPVNDAVKVATVGEGRRTDPGKGTRFTSRDCGIEGVKQHSSWPAWFDTGIAKHSSRSDARKAASALIAKIPFQLANHIAKVFNNGTK